MSEDFAVTAPAVLDKPAINALALYKRAVEKISMLTFEQEQALGAQLLAGDAQTRERARNALVTSHLPLVIKIASKNSRNNKDTFLDMVSAGNEGLIKSTKGFDSRQGRFASYAIPWIESEIKAFWVDNATPVRIVTTKPQKKVFFNLPGEKSARGLQGAHLPESVAQEIAAKLKVDVSDNTEMNRRMSVKYASIDAVMETTLVSDHSNPEAIWVKREEEVRLYVTLPEALKQLDGRDRDILTRRYLQEDWEKPATRGALATAHGVSDERIRQVEALAIQKLRTLMTAPDNAAVEKNDAPWRQAAHKVSTQSSGPTCG